MQRALHPYDGVTLLGVQSAVALAVVAGGLLWFSLADGLTGTLMLGAGVIVGFVAYAWVRFLLEARSKSRSC